MVDTYTENRTYNVTAAVLSETQMQHFSSKAEKPRDTVKVSGAACTHMSQPWLHHPASNSICTLLLKHLNIWAKVVGRIMKWPC